MDHDTRLCIYPCYLNSQCSTAQGRKIPVNQACENPTTPEIYDVVHRVLQLPADIERKRHPRDWKYLGRVRVQLKDQETGAPLKSEIATRKALLLEVAKRVSEHPSRSGKTLDASSSTAPPQQAAGGVGALPGRAGKKTGKKKK